MQAFGGNSNLMLCKEIDNAKIQLFHSFSNESDIVFRLQKRFYHVPNHTTTTKNPISIITIEIKIL